MTSVIKLKDEARRYEQQEDWDEAIQLYLRVLRGAEESGAEIELPLYNRVGDLYLRLGRAPDAVMYYEQAADHYAEAGFYNNAIALCNKALRYAPTRLVLVRKLGRFSALQGFVTDARRWYLTYAERMFAQGAAEEAIGALEDFANVSEDPEVRELLARHLHAHGQQHRALTEFRRAYGMRLSAGDAAGADELRAEVLRLFPGEADLTPMPLTRDAPDGGEDVITQDQLPGFIDSAEPERRGAAAWERTPSTSPLPGLEPTHREVTHAPAPSPRDVDGFESTSLADDEEAEPAPLPTFEPEPAAAAEAAPAPDDFEREPPIARYPGDATEVGGGEDPAPLPMLHPPTPHDNGGATPRGMNGTTATGEDESAVDFPPPPGGFIDLHAFIAPDEHKPKDTRFRIEETAPTGDEDQDFAELLAQFKAKLAEAVDPDDAQSHYDLGLAFKEMGLLDEAISEFQRSMRAGGDGRLKILEELGQCFMAKGQLNIAVKILQTAVALRKGDELELIGVFYYLGRAYEELGRSSEARDAYERVMGLDIEFEDVTERIVRL